MPAADQVRAAVLEQDFGGQGLGVVVAPHDRAVGPGALDHEQIAEAIRDGDQELAESEMRTLLLEARKLLQDPKLG